MAQPGESCSWCELPVNLEGFPRPVRLSTSQPPWTIRSARGTAGAIASLSRGFADAIRAARAEVNVTLWFHRPCWEKFSDLLSGGRDV